jgi:AcrR family transcriptional regulator
LELEADSDTQDRRTTGVQRRGRAARVVNAVLQAAAQELADVGYTAFRVEDVARRAGVNKTTVYRRWPTKIDLVTDTIHSHMYERSAEPFPDTGSLRGDLLAYFKTLLESMQHPLYRGILLTLNGHIDPALDVLAGKLRGENRQFRTRLVQRGIERGELPRTVDAELVADLVSSPILLSVLHHGETVTPSYIESVVDTVLTGTAANAFRS